jgi:hypothetical protein
MLDMIDNKENNNAKKGSNKASVNNPGGSDLHHNIRLTEQK